MSLKDAVRARVAKDRKEEERVKKSVLKVSLSLPFDNPSCLLF